MVVLQDAVVVLLDNGARHVSVKPSCNSHKRSHFVAGCREGGIGARSRFVLEYKAFEVVERSAVGGDGCLERKWVHERGV